MLAPDSDPVHIQSEMNEGCRPKIAVLGAGGFVGSRLVKLSGMSGRFHVLPVLRSFRGLSRLSSAVPDSRVIDTSNPEAVIETLRGCDTVVNLTMGDQLSIVGDTKLLYEACRCARVKRLIHLSSAVVFGRVTEPTLTDDSQPDVKSWMLYARGKAEAEVWLGEQMRSKEVAVVVLRPGLIWGPGSNWSEMVGDQLLHGSAVLSNEGDGIANLIFVDNLARIIMAVAARENGPSGFYNVADNETVTWKQYYLELAARLGYKKENICLWPDGKIRLGMKHAVEWALEQPALNKLAKGILKRSSPATKAMLKAKLKSPPAPPGGEGVPKGPPRLSRAHWVLQNTVNRLPTTKVHGQYGPLELVSFPQALEITSAWLKFAGFAAPSDEPELKQDVSFAI